jgi:hypothetical protein
MFVGFFAMSAGDVHAVSSYSAIWVDNSNPSAAYIVSCGVTRSAYNYRWSAIHEVQVETTLTSPRGRRVVVEGAGVPHSNYGSMTARAEALLAVDLNELGDYKVTSRHYSDCPEVVFGFTSDILGIGIRYSSYRSEGEENDKCLYSLACGRGQPTCGVSRHSARKLYPGRCPGPFIQCGDLIADGVCVIYRVVCNEIGQPGVCT